MKRVLTVLLMLLVAVSSFAASTEKPAKAPKAAKTAKAPKAEAKPEHPAKEAPAGLKAAGSTTLAALDAQIAAAKVDKSAAGWRMGLKVPTAVTFDPKTDYFVSMQTNKGTFTLKMHPDAAPLHVTNFMLLARMGFYDGLTFHRVIPGFMAQGGDPAGNGSGGPGYDFGGEVNPSTMTFEKAGLLSMANRGPNTDGSQFFVTFAPTPWLKGAFCVLGEVTEGREVLKLIERAGTQGGPPTEPLTIEKATVEAKPRVEVK